LKNNKQKLSRNKQGYYPIGGIDHVSVTTFLKVISNSFLMGWYAQMEKDSILKLIKKAIKTNLSKSKIIQSIKEQCLKESSAAGRYVFKRGKHGNAIHKAIQKYLGSGKKPTIKDKKDHKAFKSFLKWWSKGEYEAVAVEITISDKKLRAAGTMDAYLKRVKDGKLGIGDWKTGKNIYREHHLQNVAYRHIARKSYPSSFGLIIHVPQDGGKTTVHKVNSEKYTLKIVLLALDLWRGLNE